MSTGRHESRPCLRTHRPPSSPPPCAFLPWLVECHLVAEWAGSRQIESRSQRADQAARGRNGGTIELADCIEWTDGRTDDALLSALHSSLTRFVGVSSSSGRWCFLTPSTSVVGGGGGASCRATAVSASGAVGSGDTEGVMDMVSRAGEADGKLAPLTSLADGVAVAAPVDSEAAAAAAAAWWFAVGSPCSCVAVL